MVATRDVLVSVLMKLKVVVHPAEEGGYWAEVPSLPGCVSQGETMGELLANVREAIDASLSVDASPTAADSDEVIELAL